MGEREIANSMLNLLLLNTEAAPQECPI